MVILLNCFEKAQKKIKLLNFQFIKSNRHFITKLLWINGNLRHLHRRATGIYSN